MKTPPAVRGTAVGQQELARIAAVCAGGPSE